MDNATIYFLSSSSRKGFSFVGRQKRLTFDGDHFYADLVFYHIILKCYVIVDLKNRKLTQADLGKMQLYVKLLR
ncbi:PDDEXK nuclease domain-containing protein [Legionella qingyii]|uniref:DUF1016 family protein n=1 Tax=Legionella qingyii TaxID=2184757 RepID=A0ABY0CHQ3_9GAMM|nr:DUF1016 family protein [Legionella qingyii]RUR25666.1 DUF1016 family protein [Legionella qingyii]